MKIFLAATSDKNFIPNITDSKYILESFYYFQEWQIPLIKKSKMFMLDSGAFTFFSSSGGVDWGDYIKRYAQFINKHNVDFFFELDIDKLIGYDKVLYYRKKLEDMTGKPCIPVWHKSRGQDEFIKMCEQYNYVSIGGIVSKEITQKEYKYLPYFIKIAHEHGAKIHGLGFTNLQELTRCHFDSVDSTSWKSGGRFGQLHCFENNTIKTVTRKNMRAVYKKIDQHNFDVWVKFQQYAEQNL